LRHLVQLPLDLSVHKPETSIHTALRLLKDWDGSLTAESAAGAIYEVFIRMFVPLVLQDKLDPTEDKRQNSKKHLDSRPLTRRYLVRDLTPGLAEVGLICRALAAWLTQV
jgi:acyl-homoserine lactone acylase PvdQ